MRQPDPRDAAPPHLALTSTWSIRSKLIAVLAVPMVALVVLWVIATWVTLGPGVTLLEVRDSVDSVGRPAQALITQLQAERKLAIGHLAGDGAAVEPQYARTDAAVTDFRARAENGDVRSALTSTGADRLDDLLLHLGTLPSLRDSVERGSIQAPEALRRYTEMVEAGLSLVRTLIRPSTEDLLREAQALMALGEARELLSREDAVVSGALVAGRFTSAELSQTVQLIGARRHQATLAVVDLHPTDRAAYTDLIADDPAATLRALEDRLIAEARAGEPVPVDAAAWRGAYDQLDEDLRAFELEAADRLVERSRPDALFIFGRIIVTGLIGLLALVVTAFGSLRVARSVLRRLAGLRQAAFELAIDRIPRVVSRLREGARVDVAAEAPPLPYGDDEIGQVGHAFNALQREAVGAAVAEADLRRGVNEVFLNIARRSQTLLHRQLSILDNMERRTEDPVELEDLFRVDHLATRMRRHAEDLVILAGASPGRGWRQPVPLVDVLRGAISEIEDYARVAVRPVPDVAVTGRTVADLIHLLAELVENAATFSPPTTKVTVGAEPVTHGLAIEIEDRGIGLEPTVLDQVNARLANPPDFGELASRSYERSSELASRSYELARNGDGPGKAAHDSETSGPGAGAQLGLFVVARLAARHGIQVQLRRSPYGGTTAVVLLPDSLLARPGEQHALPAGRDLGPGALVPLTSASPTAPRSDAPVGFTPVPAQGGPLPARRPREPLGADDVSGQRQAGEVSEVSEEPRAGDIIVATTGKPLGRHAQREVIEPVDDPDGLPRRVRRQPAAQPVQSADTGRTSSAQEDQTATRGDDARTPEQIRAMMSSFQAGLARGREATDEGAPGRVDDDPAGDRGGSEDRPSPARTTPARTGRGRTVPTSTDSESTDPERTDPERTDTDRTAGGPVGGGAALTGGDQPAAEAGATQAGLDGGEQPGAQAPGDTGRRTNRRRAGGGADGEATEAT